MTTREARIAVRRVYDQWAALAKIHEALEVSEIAEGQVAALEQRKTELTAACDTLVARHAATVEATRTELATVSARAKAEMTEKLRTTSEAIATASREHREKVTAFQAEIARLDAEAKTKTAEHTARMADYAAAEREMRTRLDGLTTDLAEMKRRIASA